MYIDNSYEKKSIPNGYKQIFQNKFTPSVSKHEILRMKNDGVLTDRDLAIASFLYDVKFATVEQIYDYLQLIDMLTQKKSEGDELVETSVNSIKSRLDKLVMNRILNKFMLSVTEDKIKQDSLQIYCLDIGGKYLLNNYSEKDLTDWHTTLNLKSSGLISKDLIATHFYLNMLKTVPDKIRYFVKEPIRRSERMTILPTFEFCLEQNGMLNYFIVEVVREFDASIGFPQKLDKLDKLLSTNAWKKYYMGVNNPPIFIAIAETTELALTIARMVSSFSETNRFRVSTDSRALGDLSTAFMAYMPDVDKLKLTKSNIFSV